MWWIVEISHDLTGWERVGYPFYQSYGEEGLVSRAKEGPHL